MILQQAKAEEKREYHIIHFLDSIVLDNDGCGFAFNFNYIDLIAFPKYESDGLEKKLDISELSFLCALNQQIVL